MASYQAISSSSDNRSKVSGDKRCKVCGKECVVLLSHSPSNPNRESYSCHVPRDEAAMVGCSGYQRNVPGLRTWLNTSWTSLLFVKHGCRSWNTSFSTSSC